MAYTVLDFSDIVDSVVAELKLDPNNTAELVRVKRDINMVYIYEVVPFKRWPWLRGHTDVRHEAYVANGTVSVTPSSTTITFSTAPTTSKTGYYIQIIGHTEVFKISSHTASSTTATLTSAYTGSLDSAADYKMWTDRVALPTDCRETVEVLHDYYRSPMEGMGLQDFRRAVINNQILEGYPQYYCTTDFKDPTSGTAETESDRYRELMVYPALTTTPVTLHIDYIKEVSALDADGDEPVLPIEDRVVLVYGALARAWRRAGNDQVALINERLFKEKLQRMAGKYEDSTDPAQLSPKSSYLSDKRGRRLSPGARLAGMTGSAYAAPTYLEDVIINGATVIDNITVNSGITIDGRDISADGATLDALNTLANGKIYIGNASNVATEVTPSGDVTIDNTGVTSITAGVIVDADINASAAITKTKIAAGTASRVEVTNASGYLTESAVTSTELTFLTDVEPLTSATLADNTASATNVATWTAASYDAIIVDYSLKRGSANKACGRLFISTDGTSAAIAQSESSIGTLGVTFTVDVSAGSLRLRYTTTSTGTACTMKYKVNKWLS